MRFPQPLLRVGLGLMVTLCCGATVWGAPRVVDSFEVGENTYVRALVVERASNSLWVGTSHGVHQINLATLQPTSTFTRRDGLANEYVFAIGLDAKGYKWFGTNAGGASRYRDGHWKTYFPMHGLADYWVYAFASQRDGTLWIGTWAGANRFDLKTGTLETFVDELVNEWVYGLAVDSSDRVWFGTEGGVSRFDGKTWQAWTHADGLGAPNGHGLPASRNTGLGTRQRHDLSTMTGDSRTYNPSYVFCVLAAADDTIWAGTWGGGASFYDGSRWRNVTSVQGLAGNIVYSMVQDAVGAIWFGTDHGVSRFHKGVWHRIGPADGLLAPHVYTITVDGDGDIWAGTRRGVTRIRP